MVSKDLEKKIIITITYYDGLDYPLTSFEVWKYLTELSESNNKYSLSEISEALMSDRIRRIIGEKKGFYFLEGKEDMPESRLERNKVSFRKIKKLRNYVKILRAVPFVRMIAVTGRLSMKNARKSSDWDLLVVLESGRIWTGRTLFTVLTHLIGKRRRGKKIRDRICLNYFLTTKTLEVSNKDLFSANEYQFAFPLFGEDMFNKFQLKNSWIKGYKPNYEISEIGDLRCLKDNHLTKYVRMVGEKVFGWYFLEEFLRRIEKKKIRENPKTYQEGSLIGASDEALIFLPDPQGPKVFEKFKERLDEMLIR